MKKISKLIAITIITITILLIFILLQKQKNTQVYAATSTSASNLQLIARAINGEARGEPYEGQVAVGAVILNRVKDSKFPNTVAGVIYQ